MKAGRVCNALTTLHLHDRPSRSPWGARKSRSRFLHMYVYTHVYTYVCMHTYLYISEVQERAEVGLLHVFCRVCEWRRGLRLQCACSTLPNLESDSPLGAGESGREFIGLLSYEWMRVRIALAIRLQHCPLPISRDYRALEDARYMIHQKNGLYTCTYIYVYIRPYFHKKRPIHIHIYINIYIYIWPYTYTYIGLIHIQIYKHIYTYIYVNIYIWGMIHVCIYIYIYIHIYI